MNNAIDSSLCIKGLTLKNRIGAAPMGPSVQTKGDGFVTQESIDHFCRIAAGGAALIIHGSTSVSSKYHAKPKQCFIWDDKFIEGHSRLTKAVHEAGAKIILQLEHPGARSLGDVTPCSSDVEVETLDGIKHGRAMTVQEILDAEQEYANAAGRAYKAGYDGVELHGSHGWLINEFVNVAVNTRSDAYGQDPLLFVREIFAKVKLQVPESFPVGIRCSGFTPDLETAIEQAVEYEKMGFDFLDVSTNIRYKFLKQEYKAPEGYPFVPNIYAMSEIKKRVGIPVFAQNMITDGEVARAVLEQTNADMILSGRGMVVDPEWANKALAMEKPFKCYCCPLCHWRLTDAKCPGVVNRARALAEAKA